MLSPVTLQAVSNISRSGLMPMARATMVATCASLSPMLLRTMKRRKTEPPGMPPAPTEAKTTEMRRMASWVAERGMSKMLAARMAKTGRGVGLLLRG